MSVAISLLLPVAASAQGTTRDDRFVHSAEQNYFRRQEANRRVADLFNPGARGKDADGIGRFNEGSPVESSFVKNPNLWCNPQYGEEIEECIVSHQPDYAEGGTRRSHVVSLEPMSGFHDTMMGEVYSDAVDNVLESPLAVNNVTWMLTEPGVSRGLHQAINQASHFLNQRYQSDQAFLKRAEAHEESKDIVLQAYNTCISNWMTGRKNVKRTDTSGGSVPPQLRNGYYSNQIGNGTGPGVRPAFNEDRPIGAQLSWVEAHSRCMGGARIGNNNQGENPNAPMHNRQGRIANFDAIRPAQPLSLADHNAHSHRSGHFIAGVLANMMPGWDGDPDDVMSLVDWMFNEEQAAIHVWDSMGRYTPGDNPGNKPVLVKVKHAWRQIFGDVIYWMETEKARDPFYQFHADAKVGQVGAPITGRGRVQYFNYKRVAGVTRGRDPLTRTDRPNLLRGDGDWFKMELTKQAYVDINTVMFNLCHFYNYSYVIAAAFTAASNVYLPVMQSTIARNPVMNFAGDFWTDQSFWDGTAIPGVLEETSPLYTRIPGFSLQPALGDLLYEKFLGDERANPGPAGAEPLRNCTKLDPFVGEASLGWLMQNIGGNLDNYYLPRNKTTNRIRAYWFLAERIGTGQFLMTMQRAVEAAQARSGGLLDTTMLKFAKKMIFDAAGSEDIQKSYADNMKLLNEWLETQYARRSNEIGPSQHLELNGGSSGSATGLIAGTTGMGL